jgi:hypothetical protein
LKHGSKELIEILQEFLGSIWINENMPDEWKIGIICPLHKVIQCNVLTIEV